MESEEPAIRAEESAPGAPRDTPPDDTEAAAEIARLCELLRPPHPVQEALDRIEASRQYLHTDAMLLDEEDAVGTNFALRFQYAMLATVAPQDPRPRIRPPRFLPPLEAAGQPATYPALLVQHAQTHEVILEYQQRQCALDEIMLGAIQDAFTGPMSIVKLRWQEDHTRDGLGYARFNDQQDAIAEWQYLSRVENPSPATRQRLKELEATVAAAEIAVIEADLAANPPPPPEVTIDPATGLAAMVQVADPRVERLNALRAGGAAPELPEVAIYRGWIAQQIRPEDFRWDWQVTRPEDLRFCRWQAHRVWMTRDEIGRTFNLSEADFPAYAGTGDAAGRVVPASSDPGPGPLGWGGAENPEEERDSREHYFAVWEHWDRITGLVSVFVEGGRNFLRQSTPSATGARFFPFFAFGFNRVTGRVMGPSDTDFVQPLQDEINTLRTHEREARKSSYPRFVVKKGLFLDGEKQRFEEALPFSMTEATNAEDLARSIFPIIPAQFSPAAYDTSKALLDLQTMVGMPLAATGVAGGARLATEAAIAREGMNSQSDQRGLTIRRTYRDMYQYMAQVNAQVLTPVDAQRIAGAGAVWPQLDRQEILAGFSLDVECTLSDATERRKQLEDWMTVAGIAGQMGLPLNPIEITKEVLSLMGKRVDLERFVVDPMTLAAMQASGMGAPRNGGAANQPSRRDPEDQGPQGRRGGQRGGMQKPPAPESVPGGPLAG